MKRFDALFNLDKEFDELLKLDTEKDFLRTLVKQLNKNGDFEVVVFDVRSLGIEPYSECVIEMRITKSAWIWLKEYKKTQVLEVIQAHFGREINEVMLKWLCMAYYITKYGWGDFVLLTGLLNKVIAERNENTGQKIRIMEFGAGFGIDQTFIAQYLSQTVGAESFLLYATEINTYEVQQNQGCKEMAMCELLVGHITESGLTSTVIPFDPAMPTKIIFPEKDGFDLIFSFRSYLYLYLSEEYDQFIKDALREAGTLVVDLNKSKKHFQANNKHYFKESAFKRLRQATIAPNNAYRLIFDRDAFLGYSGRRGSLDEECEIIVVGSQN